MPVKRELLFFWNMDLVGCPRPSGYHTYMHIETTPIKFGGGVGATKSSKKRT